MLKWLLWEQDPPLYCSRIFIGSPCACHVPGEGIPDWKCYPFFYTIFKTPQWCQHLWKREKYIDIQSGSELQPYYIKNTFINDVSGVPYVSMQSKPSVHFLFKERSTYVYAWLYGKRYDLITINRPLCEKCKLILKLPFDKLVTEVAAHLYFLQHFGICRSQDAEYEPLHVQNEIIAKYKPVDLLQALKFASPGKTFERPCRLCTTLNGCTCPR